MTFIELMADILFFHILQAVVTCDAGKGSKFTSVQIKSCSVGKNALTKFLEGAPLSQQKELMQKCQKAILAMPVTSSSSRERMNIRIVFNPEGEWTREIWADTRTRASGLATFGSHSFK